MSTFDPGVADAAGRYAIARFFWTRCPKAADVTAPRTASPEKKRIAGVRRRHVAIDGHLDEPR